MAARQRCTLDVFLLLTRGNRGNRGEEVLLALRRGTGFADGMWNLPSGKAEGTESAVAAVIREAHEELGLRLTGADLSYAATVHCRNSDDDLRVGLFFQASARRSDPPHNAEPHKCGGIAWYPMSNLPGTTMPYSALGVSLYQRNERFGSVGW